VHTYLHAVSVQASGLYVSAENTQDILPVREELLHSYWKGTAEQHASRVRLRIGREALEKQLKYKLKTDLVSVTCVHSLPFALFSHDPLL